MAAQAWQKVLSPCHRIAHSSVRGTTKAHRAAVVVDPYPEPSHSPRDRTAMMIPPLHPRHTGPQRTSAPYPFPGVAVAVASQEPWKIEG